MKRYLFYALLVSFWSFAMAAEPTEMRDWKAESGHRVKAKALKVEGGKVHFERENGKTITVPMSKLVEDDQQFLTKHFELDVGAENDNGKDGPTTVAADDLGYPLGKTTAELDCGEGAHCFFYLPKSLEKGKQYPVLFIMSPGGGSAGVANRYVAGAERNGWILAVSKESKNGNNNSGKAILAMINFTKGKLPIDEKRMYTTGFSGGSRMAYWTSQQEKKIAGIIACGAGGDVGSRKQVVYGLCGSNCFNRTDMANSFKDIGSKGPILRYFEGKHVWADSEMCDDAITHLNGVFLSDNKSKYADDYTRYVQQVSELVKQNTDSKPKRAFMWADFMKRYDMETDDSRKAFSSLESDEANVSFVKGLYDVRNFAEKTFGKIPASQWKADPKVAAACLREAKRYAGFYWEKILQKMSEDAQKF
ncbi:SHD1 domain-containing protein [Oceaniferula spumae]